LKTGLIKNIGAICGVVIAVVVFIAGIISYSLYFHQPADSSLQNSDKKTVKVLNNSNIANNNSSTPNSQQSFEDKLVVKLKDLYGKTISEKSTQVLLLKIKRNLLEKFPKKGAALFYKILKRAFPKFADEIMKTLKAMEAYLKWEEENRQLLSGMNIIEKRGFLWEKRNELFGVDAEEIWNEEVESYDKRKQDMQDLLSRLKKSNDSTIYEKLDDYQQTLKDVYKNTPEAYILQSKDLIAKVFLSLDSVQNELKEMTPEDRKTELYNIRNEMGFTQAQIEQLEQIDDKKNSRWDNGLTYMDEREKITQELEGTELDTALTTLREKYFKHEAKTIQIEEDDGFFRYTRKRIYGKN